LPTRREFLSFSRLTTEGTLSDDELFVLMEMLLQSFEQSARDLESDADWAEVLRLPTGTSALSGTGANQTTTLQSKISFV
jgi:hypothetical protein